MQFRTMRKQVPCFCETLVFYDWNIPFVDIQCFMSHKLQQYCPMCNVTNTCVLLKNGKNFSWTKFILISWWICFCGSKIYVSVKKRTNFWWFWSIKVKSRIPWMEKVKYWNEYPIKGWHTSQRKAYSPSKDGILIVTFFNRMDPSHESLP